MPQDLWFFFFSFLNNFHCLLLLKPLLIILSIDAAYYHANVEIWYPRGMPDIDDFREANFAKWSQWQEQDDAKKEATPNVQLFSDPNLYFTECWDEDTDCSNTVLGIMIPSCAIAIYQHMVYFSHYVMVLII